jgi:S1-C subfamily serine protease
VYQLTVNSTGAGNSGGPVFDDRGRVIGIFTSSNSLDVKVTFAVPIRYGMELMGTSRVM